MKKFFKYLITGLDLVLAVIANWFLGLILFIFITFLSFLSYLVGGKNGLIDFYKGFKGQFPYS